MKYISKETIEKYNQIKKSVIDLWMECDSMDEFKLKMSLNGLELNTIDFLSLKLYFFKKIHNIIYYFNNIMIFLIFLLIWMGGSWYITAFGSVLTYIIFTIIFIIFIGLIGFYLALICNNFITDLEWHEDGCPIDY